MIKDKSALLKTQKGETFKMLLIKQAKKKYTHILPVRLKKNLNDCFTVTDNHLIFWFNTRDKSTHIELMKI